MFSMSVIQNFKKRQLANQSQLPKTNTDTGMPKVKPNAALTLLAKLLQVEEHKAIETAEKYIASNITYFADNEESDLADKTSEVEEHEAVKDELAADIANSSDELANSANDVQTAASDIEQSAEKASEAVSDLAYTADDISAVTEDLKEATAEIKKPLVEPKSSSSKKTDKQKSSSKK